MIAGQPHIVAARVARRWGARAAKDAPSYKDYVERKKRDGEEPMKEDEWEARVFGDEDELEGEAEVEAEVEAEQERVPHDEPLPPSIDDALDGDDGPVRDLVEAAKKKKWPTRAKVREVYELVKEKVQSFGKKGTPPVTPAEKKGAEDLVEWLTQWLDIEGTSKSKKPDLILKDPTRDRGKEPRLTPAQSESLKDYAEKTKKKRVEKEKADKADKEKGIKVVKEDKKTPWEIQEDFIKTLDDPKVKERFEDMSPEDFMAALKSMSKKGALRTATIRLAYVRPDLREHLLTALRAS